MTIGLGGDKGINTDWRNGNDPFIPFYVKSARSVCNNLIFYMHAIKNHVAITYGKFQIYNSMITSSNHRVFLVGWGIKSYLFSIGEAVVFSIINKYCSGLKFGNKLSEYRVLGWGVISQITIRLCKILYG